MKFLKKIVTKILGRILFRRGDVHLSLYSQIQTIYRHDIQNLVIIGSNPDRLVLI